MYYIIYADDSSCDCEYIRLILAKIDEIQQVIKPPVL